MKANGNKIKLKDLEHIVMKMGHNIKAAGNKTNIMDRVKKLGQMAQILKEFTWMEKKKEKATLNGPMDLVIKEILLKMTFKAMENMFGQTKEPTLAFGTKIKCMAKEHTIGPIAENTWAHIKTIKNVD